MNKKETKIDKAIKWWRNNGYKVMRVILFPIWWGVCAQNKIHDYKYKRLEWSEEKANEILSYYIPRIAEWSKEDKCFYFADNGRGWSMKCHQKKIKWKDRRWWKSHRGFYGGRIRKYLIEEFELEGFEKVVDFDDDCVEIFFKLIQE
jgi:hypothetical protein